MLAIMKLEMVILMIEFDGNCYSLLLQWNISWKPGNTDNDIDWKMNINEYWLNVDSNC